MIRLTVHFSGQVQGVGFRYTTTGIGRHHAVAGYVRNLPDGRVRLVVEGDKPAADAFVDAVRDRMADCIGQMTVAEGEATGEFGVPARGALGIRR